MTTKNEIRARVELMVNLAQEAQKIKESIASILAPTNEDDIFALLEPYSSGKLEDVNEIMAELQELGYLSNRTEGDITHYPSYHVSGIYPSSQFLRFTSPNGAALILKTSLCDFNTIQASIMYLYNEKALETNIALAEIKNGELALIDELTENNKAVDLYVYGKAFDESWTEKIRFPEEDLRRCSYVQYLLEEIKEDYQESDVVFSEYLRSILESKQPENYFRDGNILELTDEELNELIREMGDDEYVIAVNGKIVNKE